MSVCIVSVIVVFFSGIPERFYIDVVFSCISFPSNIENNVNHHKTRELFLILHVTAGLRNKLRGNIILGQGGKGHAHIDCLLCDPFGSTTIRSSTHQKEIRHTLPTSITFPDIALVCSQTDRDQHNIPYGEKQRWTFSQGESIEQRSTVVSVPEE